MRHPTDILASVSQFLSSRVMLGNYIGYHGIFQHLTLDVEFFSFGLNRISSLPAS